MLGLKVASWEEAYAEMFGIGRSPIFHGARIAVLCCAKVIRCALGVPRYSNRTSVVRFLTSQHLLASSQLKLFYNQMESLKTFHHHPYRQARFRVQNYWLSKEM